MNKKIFFLIITLSFILSVTLSYANSTRERVYSMNFDDGNILPFTTRNSSDTTTLSVINTNSYSGDYSLVATNRTEDWHGPMISISDKCTVGEEYFIKAKIMSPDNEKIKIGYKYTNSNSQIAYNTFGSYGDKGWQEVKIKFIIPKDRTNIYLYFSGGTTDIYIDDFIVESAEIQEDIISLKDVYENDFKIGGAVTSSDILSRTTQNLLKKHCNSVTLINELKPSYILDHDATLQDGGNDNPQVNIESAREILEFCKENDLPVRGHTLLWHEQTPSWFFKENFEENGAWVDKETMLKRMENYIKNLFTVLEEEYPTVEFYAWDVVNEAILDDGSYRHGGEVNEKHNGLLCSPWTKIFGDNSFIEYAFTYAREYAPSSTKLFYADFNGFVDAKREAIITMLLELKEKNLVDGYAFHGHLSVDNPSTEVYEKAILDFVNNDIEIQISEWDITLSGATLNEQAQYYGELMHIFLKYSDSISAVVFWGTTDDKSWKSSESPLLFDDEYNAKPAFYQLSKKSKLPHVYDQEIVMGKYLASKATCTKKAKYYKSCECGMKGKDTFESGDLLEHTFTKYIYNNDATYTEDGTKTAKCDYGCGTKDTKVAEGTKKETSSVGSEGGGGTSVKTYQITVKKNGNGTISPETKKIQKGENQTYKIKASEGYKIEKVIVDGKTIGIVEEYTFENVREKHTFEVTFKKIEESTKEEWINPFTDVSENDWFYEAVKFANKNKLFNGITETEFSANENMTRGMIVTVLYRYAKADIKSEALFEDVDKTAYYSKPIAWAAENGIVNGVGQNKFDPEASVTRQDFVVILYRYALKFGLELENMEDEEIAYNDVEQISEYAIPAMKWAVKKGIITGRTELTLAPLGTATRAEVATMIMRFIES